MNCKYDLAISYHHEMEEQCKKIAMFLERDGYSVFYAPHRTQELMTKNLEMELYSVFKDTECLKLLLISAHYYDSRWTTLEMRMSMYQGENLSEVIIVNYTGQELKSILKGHVYLDGRKMHEDEIAANVSEFLHKPKAPKKVHGLREESISVQNNYGIIAGDNASFGDVIL